LWSAASKASSPTNVSAASGKLTQVLIVASAQSQDRQIQEELGITPGSTSTGSPLRYTVILAKLFPRLMPSIGRSAIRLSESQPPSLLNVWNNFSRATARAPFAEHNYNGEVVP
jgi:hypothetical protein